MQNTLCDVFPPDLLQRHSEAGQLSRAMLQELRSPLCAITLSLSYVNNKIKCGEEVAIPAQLALLERNAERMARILDLFEEKEAHQAALEYP